MVESMVEGMVRDGVQDAIEGMSEAAAREGAPVRVQVLASDPVTQAGLAAQLRTSPLLEVVDERQPREAAVALVAVDELDPVATATVADLCGRGVRVVVVASRLDDRALLAAVEAGVSGLVRRGDAVTERLVSAIRAAAAGDGTLPPDLLGRLLDQVGRLQRQVLAPRGLRVNGLGEREVAVLRLIADGYDTRDIATKLSYSERTVKNVIHDITNRLNLRNRSHAVAHAIRHGLI